MLRSAPFFFEGTLQSHSEGLRKRGVCECAWQQIGVPLHNKILYAYEIRVFFLFLIPAEDDFK